MINILKKPNLLRGTTLYHCITKRMALIGTIPSNPKSNPAQEEGPTLRDYR